MNRSDARMIAEELHKFIRNDVRKAVTEMATVETEEYLNASHQKWQESHFYQISFEKIHGKKIIPDGFGRLSGN